MASSLDPYRTLGLPAGAPLEDVKRAYRRLAKANHPDAAGSGALARFLAIQAAYEQLAGPGAVSGRVRPTARARPSAADPSRADATRRAYGERGRRSPGGARPTGGAARPGGAGASGTAHRPGEPSDESTRSGRSRGKATLGSTSYDDAELGDFEPDWAGASWYGTTSGTYWTINPKEYADPRKHGPEYQARARRAAAAGRTGGPDDAIAEDQPEEQPEGTSLPPEDPSERPTAGPSGGRPSTNAASAWWNSTAGTTGNAGPTDPTGELAGETADRTGRAWPGRPGAGHPGPRPAAQSADATAVPDPAAAAADLGRALTDPHAGGPRGRILRGVVGWLPLALGLGWLVGELTGCGRFAATCDPSVTPLAAVGQVLLLAALLLLPEVAALAAGAALAVLAAAVAASLILSATGDAADDESRRTALGALLVVGWLTGFAVALVRRVRSGSREARPVS